jgi:hypothetical protein
MILLDTAARVSRLTILQEAGSDGLYMIYHSSQHASIPTFLYLQTDDTVVMFIYIYM